MKSYKMHPSLKSYLDAHAEVLSDLPDGAWMQHMEDSVTLWNQRKRTKLDPHETVLRWIKLQSNENEREI